MSTEADVGRRQPGLPAHVVTELATSVDALAALAAHLRVRSEALTVDPIVADLLSSIAVKLVGETDDLSDAQCVQIVSIARTFVHQALDLTTFIDVGTGAGWLAIAMARTFPSSGVVGIDILTEPLDLARRNVADAGLDHRIDLRPPDAATLAPESADVTWVPLPFVPLEVVPAVLGTIAAALRVGLVDVGEVPRSWPAPARLYAGRRPIT